MKRILISLVLAAILTALPFKIGFGQEPAKSKIFYGINFESNVGFISGVVLDLPGNFKSYPYARFSLDTSSYANGLQTDKTVGLEVGYTVVENDKYSITLLAGASVDWTAPSAVVANWTTYVPQSAGLLWTLALPSKTPLIGWVLPEPFGLAFWVKFRPQFFDSNTLWRDKGTTGLALYGSI